MIQRLSHVTIYVLDQKIAYDFYVNKLGFEVNTDQTMDNGFRWLTVCPKGQPDLEIALMLVDGVQKDPEVTALIRTLVEKGALGAGVFETDDCHKTYTELTEKGVEFKQPPVDRFYGIEAIMKDPFGNWFSLTQRKA
jgi:catechol 2,3-dioxygenase-like lactoylglutathione lyase family enzyme